ncbi:MAG TPA: hypothetical protein VFK02_10700 [Kofleriaceae bacterium]|nr:hypothetical protein [Kofleriaceae bacterium]
MRAIRPSLVPGTRLLRLVVALSLCATGCSHEATQVVQPANEPPPLPPASGTPIGYLLEDGRLQLTADQRTKMKEIDEELAGRLANLDAAQRNARAATTSSDDDAPRHAPAGFKAAMSQNGVRNNASAGNVPGANDGSEPPKFRKGLTAEEIAQNKEELQRVPELRATNVRVAVAKVLRLLDAEQQQIARKVLVERGVDPDTGKFESQGDPGVTPKEEPREVPRDVK